MLKAEEILAVTKLFSEKEQKAAKEKLAEGQHEVDVYVRVHGILDISSYDKESTCSIPWLKALALALHYAGATRDKAIEIIEKAVRNSLMETDELLFLDMDKIEAMEKRIKEEIVARMPKTHVIKVGAKLAYDEFAIESEEAVSLRKVG